MKPRKDPKMTQKIWLITGSGNGLGRNIAEAALKAGDNVVAGARRTEELAPLVAQYGERVKPFTLEVRDEAAAKAAVELAVDKFGWMCWSTMPVMGRLRRSSRSAQRSSRPLWTRASTA
jgi:NAD(P)-dependent dehydrogenase (short-subunit alcohol dehydrogenase family)